MKKDFDNWNETKKHLHGRQNVPYAYPREIWWCALGINIGAEIDGKNENFKRPIVVLKVYNKETLLVLPLTSKQKNDVFHHLVIGTRQVAWAKLTQTRVISAKRLLRKVDMLSEDQFARLLVVWKHFL